MVEAEAIILEDECGGGWRPLYVQLGVGAYVIYVFCIQMEKTCARVYVMFVGPLYDDEHENVKRKEGHLWILKKEIKFRSYKALVLSALATTLDCL